MPATLDAVAEIALGLPLVTEGVRHGTRAWAVAGKVFVWEKHFSKNDMKRFGDDGPPEGPILGVRTVDLLDKEALLAGGSKAFFTIPHFDGYPAFLVQLKKVGKRELREAIIDAWLATAPPKLAEQYLGTQK